MESINNLEIIREYHDLSLEELCLLTCLRKDLDGIYKKKEITVRILFCFSGGDDDLRKSN